MRTYFHSCPADTDPDSLLDPGRQFTTPWGTPDHGPCDKCEGAGSVRYECKSCLEDGAEAGCPACQGRVHFEGVCPACEGTGALLLHPTRIVAVQPFDRELFASLRERLAVDYS